MIYAETLPLPKHLPITNEFHCYRSIIVFIFRGGVEGKISISSMLDLSKPREVVAAVS